MNVAWYMARRLYSHGGDVKRVSRPAIRIATVGVSLGVAVMVISVCIVLGFKREVQQKVMGMGGHVQVLNYDHQVDLEPHPIVLDDDVMAQLRETQGVAHVQRFCNQPGMLKTEESFQGVILKGIGEEYDLGFLRQHLVEGEVPVFSDTVSSQRILLSQTLSRQLRLKVGDKVYAYFFDNGVRTRRFTVSGIYSTHMGEFDKTLIFTDLHTTRRLAGYADDQYSGAEITVMDLEKLDQVAFGVASRVNRLTDHYGQNYTSPTIR